VQAAGTLQGLLDWAESNKIATDRVTVAASIVDDAPLLVAARDVSAGEAILTIPDANWVNTAAVAKSPIGPKVAGLEPWLQLALLLLHERRGGGGGVGGGAAPAAFVASLPAALDTPLFWSDDEVDLLQGTQLLQQLYGYRWAAARRTTSHKSAGLTGLTHALRRLERPLWGLARVQRVIQRLVIPPSQCASSRSSP
jgi:hypothetical protein